MFGSFSPFRCRRVTFLVQNHKNDYKNFIKISVAYFINSKLISTAYFMKSLFIWLMGHNRTNKSPFWNLEARAWKLFWAWTWASFVIPKIFHMGPVGLRFLISCWALNKPTRQLLSFYIKFGFENWFMSIQNGSFYVSKGDYFAKMYKWSW